MLKTRVITALILLAILLAVLFSGSLLLFAIAITVFFAAAAWECSRLFGSKRPMGVAAIWVAAFCLVGLVAFNRNFSGVTLLFGLCAAIWGARLTPSLFIGLPATGSTGNLLLGCLYGIAIIGCFLAMVVLFMQSPLHLLAVMAIVWIADIGAYFSGKAFGKRKLAPSISPGKSWEGAIGGWLAVLLLMGVTTFVPALGDTFAARLQQNWGWLGFVAALTVLAAASVVGDLFESQLKRRAGMKDSSALLPGHGGILDRIDALIPVLPLAALFVFWL